MIQSNIKLQGEPSAQALASGLATLGRYGDNYMVHAAEGETFVPKEILDANPALKTQLFDQMRSMGIENPNRYVVGDALNSINPVTGQPEFFFKKIFKAVKRVFKKVLPVAAPIIGNAIAPGIGGLIASGLATKLQGGSWGDALKSAGLAYAGGALTQGIMGGINAPTGQFGSGFTQGLTSGAMAPFQAASNLFSSGANNPLSQGIFGGSYGAGKSGVMDYLYPSYNPNAAGSQVTGTFNEVSEAQNAALGPERRGTARIIPVEKSGPGQMNMVTRGGVNNIDDLRTGAGYEADMLAGAKAEEIAMGGVNAPTSNIATTNIPTYQPNSKLLATELKNIPLPDKVPGAGLSSFLKDQGLEYASGTAGNIQYDSIPRYIPNEEIASQAVAGGTSQGYLPKNPDLAAKMAAVKPESSMFSLDNIKEKLMSKEVLGPVLSATIPAGIAYFAAPDEVSEEDQAKMTDPQRSAYEQYKAGKANNPNFAQTPEGQSLLRQSGIAPTRTAEQLSRSTGVSLADAQRFMRDRYGIVSAAVGGEVTGPGSGTSDSIPAMLSDGEFVMTAKAVRNAGNGNRDLGAARMYDMMNKFERAV